MDFGDGALYSKNLPAGALLFCHGKDVPNIRGMAMLVRKCVKVRV